KREMGQVRNLPHSCYERLCELEVVAQRHLVDASSIGAGGDLPERRRRGRERRVVEVGVVPSVIRLDAEREALALRDLEALHQRDVVAEEARTTESVAAGRTH